jgi:hypothetical protein
LGTQVKIRGGTRSESEQSLCFSCKNCTHIQGPTESTDIVYCDAIGKRITFPVTECTAFKKFGEPSLNDMRDTAYYLVPTNKKKGGLGFITSKEYEKSSSDYWNE